MLIKIIKKKKKKICKIRSWNAGVGPTKDAYTIGDNPQYTLRVGSGQGSVWVLLTRHITSIEDFRENHEYITLLVYQNNGRRVYYPCKFNRNGKINMLYDLFDKFLIFALFQMNHLHILMEYGSIVPIIWLKFV